jgi:hypothetical protein
VLGIATTVRAAKPAKVKVVKAETAAKPAKAAAKKTTAKKAKKD